MKIQGFIFNWKGHETRARAHEEKIKKCIEVTVINSDEQLSDKYSEWVHLDDTAYFTAQWNKAVELFDADIFFHIQADAEFDQFDLLIAKAKSVYERHKFGVYEPNVDFTELEYDKSKLLYIDSNLVEVPVTDCTCWFINGNIIRMLPHVNASVNYYGWGIPNAIASLCWMYGLPCVRDYDFLIKHPRGRGYASSEALRQMLAYFQCLSPEMRKEIALSQAQMRYLIWPHVLREYREACGIKAPA